MRTAIIGYGKMGHEIERILLERGHLVDLVIDCDNCGDLDAGHLQDIDVAIEFTTPQTAFDNVRRCLECGTAVVCGTTGWTDRLPELQALCAERGGAMMYSSNYSLGVNVTFRLNRYLAEMMNHLAAYEVTIDETHHIHKKDAPSGTAISLANDIIDRLDRKTGWVCDTQGSADEIEITSHREGEIAGIHTVRYESADDVLELKHSLKSRRSLATGAVVAAEFICGRKGVFTIDDLFNAN